MLAMLTFPDSESSRREECRTQVTVELPESLRNQVRAQLSLPEQEPCSLIFYAWLTSTDVAVVQPSINELLKRCVHEEIIAEILPEALQVVQVDTLEERMIRDPWRIEEHGHRISPGRDQNWGYWYFSSSV